LSHAAYRAQDASFHNLSHDRRGSAGNVVCLPGASVSKGVREALMAAQDSRPCKLCGSKAEFKFGLPRNKEAGGPIPDEPDDCPYFQCTSCFFLFTDAIDTEDHTKLYDETYWNTQDPAWYGRVTETLRLVLLANELLRRPGADLEILDFGCGMGSFVESGNKSLNMKVWGTDIIQPKLGQEWFLPDLKERRFDLITACEVIEHLPDPRNTFAYIRSHLKSPGVFAFQTAYWDPEILGRDWWYLGPHNGHISLYSAKSFDYVFRAMKGADRRLWNNYPGVQAWIFK
jgi:Methyltransferase domain